MIQPDFILGGAPKCGTGSLFSWLSDHPRLRGSTPKEPFYFMDRDNPLIDPKRNVHTLGIEGWRRAFTAARREPGILYFEGTTHLIYQATALAMLPRLSTQPKFIFVLRDPIDRVVSSFNYTRTNLAQMRDGLSLARYLEMLATGDTGSLKHFITSNASAFVLRRDLQYSNYWPYLQRWLEVVGPERLLVLQFERLAREPLETMRRVCDFLGISSEHFEGSYDFSVRNATAQVAHVSLHRWAKRIARMLPNGPLKEKLSDVYYRLQRVERASSITKLSPKARSALWQHLGPGTLELAETFDIDLTLWKSASAVHRTPATARSDDSGDRSLSLSLGAAGRKRDAEL